MTDSRWICIPALAVFALLVSSCGKSSAPASPGGQAASPAPPPARLHLVLEADQLGSIVAPMAVAEDSAASGGKYVKVPAGLPKEAPLTGKLETTVDVPAAGQVNFWYRVLWNGTCSNSVTVKLGSFPEFIVGEDGTYKAWHWVKSPSLDLPAGQISLVIAQREEDIGIDQILITADADFVPVDIEN